MSIDELLKKVKNSAKKRTPEDRRRILVSAQILDKDGNWDPYFFPEKNKTTSKSA